MLGSDKSRGYCLEMIYADFPAGANFDEDDSVTRLLTMLSSDQRKAILLEHRCDIETVSLKT